MKLAARVVGCCAPILIGLVGCTGHGPPEHWLDPCQQDGECGSLVCQKGVCTITCRTEEECALSSEQSAFCVDTSTSDKYGHSVALVAVCRPPCGNGPCPSDVGLSTHTATLGVESVPECPTVAETVSRPAVVMRTSESDYDGPATVTAVDFNSSAYPDAVAFLGLTDRAGASFAVHFMRGTLDGVLSVGRRVSVALRTGGIENLTYNLLVLRDEQARLLLTYHSGSDELYQSGLFDTPETTGFTLALKPLCRSAADGCFEYQSQALYGGDFTADDRLSLRFGQEGHLTIANTPYSVSLWAGSVDGGRSRCPSVPFPGRYIDFVVY
jgi:hypothetical protein